MSQFDKLEDPRRRLLVEALALGLFSTAMPARVGLAQGIFGNRLERLPPGQSVYRLSGTVTVNGTAATLQTKVRPGDTVETGERSEIIFVVGGHAMILRDQGRLEIEGTKQASASLLIRGLRLLTGKLLSVSRNTTMRVITATATIGIRGTGWYAESEPAQTYFCNCYGVIDVTAKRDPQSRTTVQSTHHDRPLYILGSSAEGKAIRDAPFINHTDQELMLIERLVGRTPPFVFPRGDYGSPRRDY
ncbi:MAG TPA: hypothetical protein VLA41_03160 [Burkholderiales bacterium]|nr:hypothetical protein [Burkholderiales bacterium]